MSARRRALLVAWLFPPHSSVGARRAWKLARHLPSYDWDVTVLCGRAPPSRFLDATPARLPESVRVHRVYDDALLAHLARWADDRAHRSPGSMVHDDSAPPSLLSRALPMESIAVHLPHALVRAASIARRERVDAIVTTSYPFSSHLLGMALAKRLSLPWIADLRDPWTLHFSHDAKLQLTREIERALEAKVFREASAVTVTTETLASAYRALYPQWADKFHAIRNGFDREIAGNLVRATEPSSRARLVHFGHVYGGARSLAPTLHALAALDRAGVRDFQLENYGRFSLDDQSLAERLGLAERVIVRAPLPYAEGVAALRSASALLLPTWGSAHGPLFLPAKLYDYLMVGRPIVATGTSHELAEILRETRAGSLHDERSVEAIAGALRSAIEGACARPDADAVERFSAQHAAERMASLLGRRR